MPNNARQESHFIFLTLILVLILGVPTLRSLSLDEGSVPVSKSLITTSIAASDSYQETRGPASSDSSTSQNTEDSEKEAQVYRLQAENIQLDCQKSEAKITIHSLRLKIESSSCPLFGKTEALKIINESNGFTASIFPQNQNSFTTDLIHLNPGKNIIKLKDKKSVLKEVHVLVNPLLEQVSEKSP